MKIAGRFLYMCICLVLGLGIYGNAFAQKRNSDPVAVADRFEITTGETLTINPLANDSDPDGDPFYLVDAMAVPQELSVIKRAGGLLEVTANGPAGDYNFEYLIGDTPKDIRASSRVTMIVKDPSPVNQAPSANPDKYTLKAGETLVIFPLENDTDPEDLHLTLDPPMKVDPGLKVELSVGESFTVTAARPGDYRITYTITDSDCKTDSSVITLTVVKDAPEEKTRSTARLNEYVVLLDGLAKGLTTNFDKANPLVSDLPNANLWPELQNVSQQLEDSLNCPAEIHERHEALSLTLSKIRARASGVKSLQQVKADWAEINEDAAARYPRIQKIGSNLPRRVKLSEYSSYDNAIGTELEYIYDLDLKRMNLLQDMAYYQPENWGLESFDDLAAEIDDLSAEVELCEPKVFNKPPVVINNSYEFVSGKSRTIDPLSDDYDPEGENLMIAAIRAPAGVVVNGFNLLAPPPFTVNKTRDNQIEIVTGDIPGRYTIEIDVSDPQGAVAVSLISLDIVPPEKPDDVVHVDDGSTGINTVSPQTGDGGDGGGMPWWIWPALGAGILGAGAAGYLLRGQRAAPIAKPLPQSARRLIRPNMNFRRKDDGVPFGKSPLIASVTEPGPPPREPAGHTIPAGLPTISGPYAKLGEAYRATGRIGFAQEGVPTNDDVALGTGFLIAPNLIMTNQHVYEFYKQYLEGPECGGIEFIAEQDRDASDFYEFDGEAPTIIPDLDIAIFRLKKKVKGRTPIDRIHVPTDDLDKREVIVVGYPCPFEVDDYILSLVEPDPVFAIKRVTQGFVFRHSTDTDLPFGIFFKVDAAINSAAKMKAVCHNATTLPGNSGSPVLCAATGKLLGVHFAGSRSLFGKEAANLAMEIELIIAREKAKES